MEDDFEDIVGNGLGVATQSYTVIKSQPFFTIIEAPGRFGLFNTSIIQLSLNYYDSNTRLVTPQEVTYVKTFPIEYKTRVNSDGTELEVESIIYALTSQHAGALFCVVVQITDIFNNYTYISTAPLKVVSKTDSLSVTMPTSTGHRKTLTEVLDGSLNKLELSEVQNTRMLAVLCKSRGLVHDDTPVTQQQQGQQAGDVGGLVKRLCNEYRALAKNQRSHRLLCEVAALLDDDLMLLFKVNEAFCDSFQRVFDANYEALMMGRYCQ